MTWTVDFFFASDLAIVLTPTGYFVGPLQMYRPSEAFREISDQDIWSGAPCAGPLITLDTLACASTRAHVITLHRSRLVRVRLYGLAAGSLHLLQPDGPDQSIVVLIHGLGATTEVCIHSAFHAETPRSFEPPILRLHGRHAGDRPIKSCFGVELEIPSVI